MSSFRASSNAQAEVDALMRREVQRFGRKLEARAKAKYRQKLGKTLESTGRTESSIRLDFGPSGLSLQVGLPDHMVRGTNVPMVLHQGHGRIRARSGKYMKFVVNGRFVSKPSVRAVAGVPFLRDALREVSREEGWKYVAAGPRARGGRPPNTGP